MGPIELQDVPLAEPRSESEPGQILLMTGKLRQQSGCLFVGQPPDSF